VAAWVPRLIPMSLAVAVSVATDFLAYLPTFRHAWLRPGEEPWIPYAMFGAAAGLVLAVADFRVMAGVIYPTYLFAADAAMVIMILASPHHQDALRPAARSHAFGLVPEGVAGGVPAGVSRAPMRLSAASAQWRPVTGRDWRQPDLGPGVPQPVPDYGPQHAPGYYGPPPRMPDHGPPQRARDYGRPLRAEPTSW